MRAILTIALILASALPAAAQHPYLRPDVAAREFAYNPAAYRDAGGVGLEIDLGPLDASPGQVPLGLVVGADICRPGNPPFWRERLFWVKVGSTGAVVSGSSYDFWRSNQAIYERRGAEGNLFLARPNGTVSGWKKAGATALAEGGTWGFYALGYKRTSIIADAAAAVGFFLLGRRARTINRKEP